MTKMFHVWGVTWCQGTWHQVGQDEFKHQLFGKDKFLSTPSLHWERLSASPQQDIWSMGFNVGECIGHWQEAEVSGEDSMKLQQRPLGYKSPPNTLMRLNTQLTAGGAVVGECGSFRFGGPTGGSGLWEQKAQVCYSPALLLCFLVPADLSEAALLLPPAGSCFYDLALLSPSHWPGSTPRTVSQNETFFLQLSLVFGHNGEESTQYVFWKPRLLKPWNDCGAHCLCLCRL